MPIGHTAVFQVGYRRRLNRSQSPIKSLSLYFTLRILIHAFFLFRGDYLTNDCQCTMNVENSFHTALKNMQYIVIVKFYLNMNVAVHPVGFN